MRIFIETDLEAPLPHIIMSGDGRMSPMPAGPRLFRAPPFPDIRFSHDNFADAERDAGRLRTYLANLSTRKQTKKDLQAVAA